ncbi:oligosaccharyl transferase, archaeosortase A system-associated [Halosolutus amylolyticus]|uniref:dolichyl-phosphooligosaccharide-protein glycotransferase n=1 Tax=Halosolutus amylolyticus TaxID=2932267 RepID=A0ABD5PRR4_9EURY|nr:oligosaccharyl transferase, archaeosortase A system-associated [Halosolutus amylolyticus]
MSTDTERVEEGTETSFLETWRDWYHIPVVGAVMLFMFWVRTQSYSEFVTDDGTPALAGVDSWYHWRTIQWTAENYPRTMPYEVWTGFPTGQYVGQFGTLFDQLIVTVAMIVGLGDPSPETLYTVSLLAIPAMAALVAVPVFYAGRRLGGTIGGIVSVIVLALAPGQFFVRSTVGQLDHHVGEVLFMAIAVVAMMVALRVGEEEKPIYELVADRDWDALRRPAIYSALAGFALALYIWVWPAAIVLVGIFGVFFAVQLSLDYVRGVSPDHVAFVGAVSLGVTTIVTALLIEQSGFGTTDFSFLQPLTALLVAVGCVFMAWLAREWNSRDLERRYYPAAIAGIAVAAIAVMWLTLPDLYSTLMGNLTSRLLPLDPSTGTLTIQEAQPPENFLSEYAFEEFGAAFYTMLAGLALLAVRPFLGREFRAEYTLVIVWSLFLLSMAATQIRFAYYLVLAVAVVNAVFVADVVRIFDLDVQGGVDSLRQIETYQVIVLFMVVLLLFAPLLPPLASAGVVERGDNTGPHSDAMTWEQSTHWLEENTPEPGNYGDAENADQLDYYGTYNPDDGDYDYPDGAYGVMSWWDYGHLITTQGERIPHSNPFQQNARSSSAYLTAESEAEGELVLDAIASDADVNWGDYDQEELESIVADSDGSGEEIRYVMIDDQMVGGKFSAITQWTGPDRGHYVTPDGYEEGDQIPVSALENASSDAPYHDTMQARLYFDDASGMEHYRLVHENDDYVMAFTSYAIVNTQTGNVLTEDLGTVIDRLVQQQGEGEVEAPEDTAWEPQIYMNQRGGPQQIQQRYSFLQQIPQLELQPFDVRQAAAIKTYERVEGATLTGTVEDEHLRDGNATVRATVELDRNSRLGSLTYQQTATVQEDGSFEMTVPYATDDELGVEDGATNSDVEANGSYSLSVVGPHPEQPLPGVQYEGQTEVPETAVVDGETIDVDLEEVEFEETDPGNESDGNETDAGNETGDDGTAGNETGDNETQTDETAGSIAPIAAEPAH